MNANIDWLLGSEPWAEYRKRLDLLGQEENDAQGMQAKEKLLHHPMIEQMISELSGWDKELITNHKKAGLWLHKLSFLAEIGLTADDDVRLKTVADAMMQRIDERGVPMVSVCIPKAFGGTNEPVWSWSLCDGPLAMWALAKMGYAQQMRAGTEYLCTRIDDFGWPCASSPSLGKFRGPGKKNDPCPYGTLLMLKLLAQFDDLKDSEQAHIGSECLLGLWTRSRDTRPYLFRMGTDFRKLKAPFVWYDILHVADVLSHFDWLKNDERMMEILGVITAKANEDGAYVPESVWMAYKGFDFAQKKQPSPWITFLIYRIQKRLGV